MSNAANTQAEPSSETAKTPKAPKQTKAMFNYTAFLSRFPKPGGEGAHAGLFRLGAMGYKAGVSEDQIMADVTAKLDEYVHSGTAGRIVSRTEIEQGVKAGFTEALEEHTGAAPAKRKAAGPVVKPGTFEKIALANSGATFESIMAKSPVPLNFPEWEAGWRVIEALFEPDDLLYAGEVHGFAKPGKNILKASEWVEIFKKGPPAPSYMIPNPLSGLEAPTANGASKTFRGDNNVVRFRHAVFEMDQATLRDQLAFWSWAALPVRALIYSGGKSIHAWVDVDCADVAEWEREVEEKLFMQYMHPLGCDSQCRNESRISRMPGHTQGPGEKHPGAVQKLLWLAPEGKAVCK